jgi:hypothetical protein
VCKLQADRSYWEGDGLLMRESLRGNYVMGGRAEAEVEQTLPKTKQPARRCEL